MTLTIVMYHYVRDPEQTAWPGIKARRTEEFRSQLDRLERSQTLVGCDDVVAAVSGGAALPEAACLLSFDDGLRDHVETVLPELVRRGFTGCFAVPAAVVAEQRVLDVQKVQFIVATVQDHEALRDGVLDLAAELGGDTLPSRAELLAASVQESRFDAPATAQLKRLLQDVVPDPVRTRVLDELFRRHVSRDEAAFAGDLYVSRDDLRALIDAGMTIAGHGYDHLRLDLLDEDAQRDEVARTHAFLESVAPAAAWTMVYPWGARNETTRDLLREHGAALGLTTDVGVVESLAEPLDLPRLDTNDVPCAAVSSS